MWKITVVVIALFASTNVALVARSQRNNKVLEDNQKCTSIGVGKTAMADGSTVTTHNNDCQECDIRITHVPARDWPTGSLRPIHDIRDHYPRYYEDPGSELNVHGPDYDPVKVDTSIYNWTYIKVICPLFCPLVLMTLPLLTNIKLICPLFCPLTCPLI